MDNATNAPDSPLSRPETAMAPRLPRDVPDLNEWRTALHHPAMSGTMRLIKLVLRGIVLFAISFIEIIAELLAPIVLICGVIWAALPGLLSAAVPEGQGKEILATVMQNIPAVLHIGRLTITPTGMILDGLLLIAIVALSRTMQTIVTADL